jgi:hypothetical protein
MKQLYGHACWAIALLSVAEITLAKDVDFQRDIRPILSDACFQCHGADDANRQAALRLDRRDGVFAKRDGRTMVVPHQPQASEVIRRITSKNPEVRMPPQDKERQLAIHEIDLLRRWIDEGATWKEHWAFVAPQQPSLPEPQSLRDGRVESDWPRNPIDLFVLQRLEQANLQPSPPADRARVARRAALTLTGLPPDPDERARFVVDQSPGAYGRHVDQLLASPRHGEHASLIWLDLARYADTDGYQDDEPRGMWRWRDWLIDALNGGMTFDQFTIEMLAGDLLPDPTDWQRLATGFHRNHRTNGETGTIAEEFRVEYVADCVETTSTVWLGLTLGCCRCHDHKYDPFSQRDFYRMFAFFNNTPEKGVYRGNTSPPLLITPTEEQQRKLDNLDRELAQATDDVAGKRALQAERKKLWNQVSTMVMADGEPRDTFVLLRGQYNQPGERVTAGTPRGLPDLSRDDSANRLDLARWLVSDENPLTARVAVNRIWAMHFGTGLVKTAEDFGSQGEPPSHPELLDWLAAYFIRSGWDVKRLHRLIVTSATFQQSSVVDEAALAVDPESRLLWRFPRRRLKAEQIRDRALAVSGLLVERMGGPSVKPYQPAGVWDEIAGGAAGVYEGGYKRDAGPALYRRSLYTFWRRTIPPPGMATFDAPSRETCTARRPSTSTPLQALSLLNDVTYLETARVLAERMMASASTPQGRVEAGFQRALSRAPLDEELSLLVRAHNRFLRQFRDEPKRATELIRVGEFKGDDPSNHAEVAACMSIGNVLLNLDEFVVVE